MSELRNEKCVACRRDAPRVTETEMKELRPQIPEWDIRVEGGIPRLTREYSFDNWATAIAFTNRVGDLAEAEAHHPEIILEWGKVRVTWWTHKIKNLHRNDLIMAAKTDALI